MLKTNQQKINLGSLKFGVPHAFSYEISNPTANTITINKLVMGCNSCTKADIENHILPPGSTTKINVIFTPGSTGLQSKHIDVMYNGTSLSLKFTAKVEK